MLAELGFSITGISIIFPASIPYSFKFIISPFVIGMMSYLSKKNINDPRKVIAIFMQVSIIILMSCLGFITKNTPPIIIILNVFLLSMAGAIHDIIGDHVRLKNFSGKGLGVATSVGTIGFRIGMLLSGAGTLYIATSFGWKFAFCIISLSNFISTLSTILLPSNSKELELNNSICIKDIAIQYYHSWTQIIKKYGLIAIVIFTISFKFSDSCINSLKPIFLHSKLIGKVDFANISQLLGTISIITGGAMAGIALSKIRIADCIKISFFSQILAAICYVILSLSDYKLQIVAIFINIGTFLFGFSAVIYRTYISNISMSSVNNYTLLISIGSIVRIFSSYIGGKVSEEFGWTVLFILCIVFTIPGLVAENRLKCKIS